MSNGQPRAIRIAPSILTADFGRLTEEAQAAEEGGANLWHLDVMDGHFVPQMSFGAPVVEAIERATAMPIEVHMMVADPAAQFAALADAGADTLVFHIEAVAEIGKTVELARATGCAAGVAVSPDSGLDRVEPLLASLDEVIVMTVHPGRGGQQMLVEPLEKVRRLRGLAEAAGRDIVLTVDGGVKAHNAHLCVEAGADTLVAGSAVFNPEETPQQALSTLRRVLAGG
jgi:ribulose-phosphate 3-epimerase